MLAWLFIMAFMTLLNRWENNRFKRKNHISLAFVFDKLKNIGGEIWYKEENLLSLRKINTQN